MLPESARSVLKLLASDGPSTRPVLAQKLGLSKPTMSAAMTTLTTQDLVTTQGESRGATGRSAQRYALGPEAGYVIGLDIGSTQVSIIATRLDGETICEDQRDVGNKARTPKAASVTAAAAMLDQVIRTVGSTVGPLRSTVAAVSALIRPTGAPERNGIDLDALHAALPDSVTLRLENNVNCATIAEHNHGAARGRDSFVYLQAGVKIGLGIVANDRLLRGAGGGAGEIGHLSFPWSPSEAPKRSELERYLGSTALLRRVRASWAGTSKPPRNTTDLFDRARAGETAAQQALERHAEDLGRLVSSIVAILDPGLVVMGGGIGQNPELAGRLRRTVAHLAWPTELEVSPIGQEATLLGTADLAMEEGLRDLLTDGH